MFDADHFVCAIIIHIKVLRKQICQKRSALPSSSAINWASMFMGAGPELHGYTQWGSKTPELPSRVLNQHGIFPTIFQLLRDAQPNAEIGCLYEWDGIKYLVDTLALSHYKQAPDYNKYPEALCTMAVKPIHRLLLPHLRQRPTYLQSWTEKEESIMVCAISYFHS